MSKWLHGFRAHLPLPFCCMHNLVPCIHTLVMSQSSFSCPDCLTRLKAFVSARLLDLGVAASSADPPPLDALCTGGRGANYITNYIRSTCTMQLCIWSLQDILGMGRSPVRSAGARGAPYELPLALEEQEVEARCAKPHMWCQTPKGYACFPRCVQAQEYSYTYIQQKHL
jgi:hypothetical protein